MFSEIVSLAGPNLSGMFGSAGPNRLVYLFKQDQHAKATKKHWNIWSSKIFRRPDQICLKYLSGLTKIYPDRIFRDRPNIFILYVVRFEHIFISIQ